MAEAVRNEISSSRVPLSQAPARPLLLHLLRQKFLSH